MIYNYSIFPVKLFQINKMNMNLSRCICLAKASIYITPNNALRQTLTSFKRYTAAASTTTQPEIKSEEYDFEDLNIADRVERRKPKIQPFMKDVFVSQFNRELLAYPEILNKDETEELNNRIEGIEAVFHDVNTTKDKQLLVLRNSKIYGAPMSLFQGGLAMNVTERLSYLETLSAIDFKLAKRISDNWVCLHMIKNGFSEEDQNKILSEIISGEVPISFCVKEKISTRVLQQELATTARRDAKDEWSVTGNKMCNSPEGYMVTVCNVDQMKIQAFLIHPKARGVERNGPHVSFIDTPATPIGTHLPLDTHRNILNDTLAYQRLDTSVIAYSLVRQLILKATSYVRGKFVSGKPLSEVPAIRHKVAEALSVVYCAESMAYFTAGLLDGYTEPDAELETAMCRSFATRMGVQVVGELLTLAGVDGFSEEWTRYLDEIRLLLLGDESNDSVNLYIALNGLSHAGKLMAEEVHHVRNPLFHPGFIIKKLFENRHQVADKPKLNLLLDEHLHPSLQSAARDLEYCVLRLRYACETLLSRHGADVHEAQLELDRLARAGTEVYAMTAALARASRSYCIGVRNAEIEMRLAMVVVEFGKKRVRSLISELEDGEYLNMDNAYLAFGQKVLDSGSLVVERPTSRVYW